MTLDAQSLNLNARQILLKRLSTAQALAYTGPLGEVIIDTNLKLLRVQDGVTPGGFVMATSSNIAYLQSQINSILNNVDPAALDSLSEVVANVNALLANNIESQLVNSGFYANLGNTGNLTIDGSFLPKGHLVQDLGSPTQAWRNIYISSSTAYFGNAAVSVTSNGLTVSMAGNVLPVIANVRFPDGTTQRTAVDMAVLANIYTLLTPTVSANLNIIHNDISNATSHFGNIANAAVSTAQANLQAQIDYIKTNIDPAALDSLTEIIASFQNIDANIVSNIGTLGNVVGNLVATKDRLTSGNVQMLLTAGAQPSVQFPVGPAGQIIISEAEITALSGNLTLTSMGDAYILSNGDGAAPGAGKLWKFDRSGNLTLPFGTAIGSTANSAIIKPPTATSAQSLVLRPTAATWAMTSSGFIVYGSPITISIDLLSYTYFGTVNYEITGPGVTPQTLGRALTGSVVFAGVPNPDSKTVTWTIPANSTITEFTFTLTTVNGTRSTGPGETDPALYYNFELNAMPTGSAITVTNNGVSNTEFSHIHLLAGDPTSVDLYLGDDDQYVKIEKNAGNVVIGTNNNTKNWTFGTNGNLTLPQTNMNSSPAPISLPGITFTDGTFQTTAYTGAAAKVDITNTNGLTTTYYPTFVESRINGQYMRADVDLTYRTDDNLLRAGNIQVGTNIYGSAFYGISTAIQLRPNIDIDKRFLFTVDSSGGNYIRSGMEMPMAEVDKAVTLAFPHDNSTAGYIFNQGTDTNGTEWNNALVIFQNGGNVKIGTITNGNGIKIWEFNQTGKIRFPDASQQSTAWTGNVDTANGYINFTGSPTPVSTGITFADGSSQTTAWTRSAAQVQSSPPTSPVTGQLYYDTDDGKTYIWTGSAWVDASPSGSAAPTWQEVTLTGGSGAGALYLTSSSPEYTYVVTSNESRNIRLPSSVGLVLGRRFVIRNSGNAGLPVQSSTGTAFNLTIYQNQTVTAIAANVTVDGTASWMLEITGSALTGVGSHVMAFSPTITTPTMSGATKMAGVHEKFSSFASVSGVVSLDASTSQIFYITSPGSNWTPNLLNLNLTSTYATAVTFVISQGATAYYPNALQIGGVAQTINWQGNQTPTPTANRVDTVTFSIFNNSGTYTVLGQMTGF